MFVPFWSTSRRRRAMRNRVPMPDDQFARELGLPNDNWAFAMTLRRVFGRCCKIPPESIYPDDSFYDLAGEFMYLGLGWDELEFLFALEVELGFKIRKGKVAYPPDDRYVLWRRRAPGIRVSEWISQVAPQLQKVVRTRTDSAATRH